MKEKYINVLVVPTNSCNLRCKYCYHSTYGYEKSLLSIKRLKRFFCLLAKEYENVSVFWHGGEPLIAGINYYKNAVKIQEKLSNKYNCKFLNKLQTNATLINKDWIDFFKSNNFSIGISYDGPNNDNYRQKGDIVLKNIELIKENGMHTGVISVITDCNLQNADKLYDWFNSHGISCKLNPLFLSGSAEENSTALNKEEYVEFLKHIFNKWLYDKNGQIIISNLQEVLLHYLRQSHRSVCAHNSCLTHYLGLTPNGDIYPCARSWPQDYLLANIDKIKSISEIFESENFINLIKKSMTRRDNCKKSCNVSQFCKGGCNNIALLEGKIDSNGGWTCYVTREICNYVLTVIKDINSKTDPTIYNPQLQKYIKNYINSLSR